MGIRITIICLLAICMISCGLPVTTSLGDNLSNVAPELDADPAPQGAAPRALSFNLDVGSANDTNTANQMYLKVGNGISGIKVNGPRTYRELNESKYMDFFVKTNTLQLAPNGVPYHDAIMTIVYQDTVHETNCQPSDTSPFCRDYVQVRLGFGDLNYSNLWGIGGYADGAWKNTSVFIENNPWQTLRSIDGLFQFRIYNQKERSGGLPLPIDHINLTFVDSEQFQSERELERESRGYVRKNFSEITTINRIQYPGKYVVYVRNYLEKVYPNSIPKASEITDRINTFEVRGELEPVTFSIYAFEDLQGMKVNVTSLINTEDYGRIIPASNIRIEKVVCIDKKWGYGYDKYYGTNPWFMENFSTLDVKANTSQQVWLTIHVPENVPRGTYEGTITVSGNAIETKTINVSMYVYDLELDPPDVVPYLYHSPYNPSKHYSNPRNVSAKDMADHDIYPIPVITADIDPNLNINFKNMSNELQSLKDFGILADHTRVIMGGNWRTLWYWIYKNDKYFQGNTTVFDEKYKQVLREYKKFFNQYCIEPDLSFIDEPDAILENRRAANHLNRLANEVGIRTWVTYFDDCEKPLAGHILSFSDQSGLTKTTPTPGWLKQDANLQAYWDFEGDTIDKSMNSNDGILNNTAEILNGEAVFHNERYDYMRVPDNDSLDLVDRATIYLWLKPEVCTSADARQILRKRINETITNYVIYYFGSGAHPDVQGEVGVKANIAGHYTLASDTTHLKDLGNWYNLIWIYDADTGGTLYVNGQPFRLSNAMKGNLMTNNADLYIGGLNGSMDEIMILDRVLTKDEIVSIIKASGSGYNTNQALSLSTTIPAGEHVPNYFNISIVDNQKAIDDDLETIKILKINGQVAWKELGINERGFETFHINISSFVKQGIANQFEFEVLNNYSRSENLTVYFIDKFFRNRDWAVTKGTNWNYKYDRDDNGDLGPMDPFLDDRVCAMLYVSSEQANMARESGDCFSYYTTGPATQAIPLYNRFLNGIYASAMNACTVNVYAYGDWGEQPYDDMWQQSTNEMTTGGQNTYELALPTWDQRMLDTIAWESLREGIEDSRIIATLERAIKENDVPESTDARDYLDGLYSRPNKDYYPAYMGYKEIQPIEKYSDRSGDILTDMAKGPENYSFFDVTRKKMLDHLINITKSKPPFSPKAVIEYSPSEPEPYKDVTFDGSKSSDEDGVIMLYVWDFGDGQYENGKKVVSHKYANGTIYNVTLTVYDNNGLKGTSTISVPVLNRNYWGRYFSNFSSDGEEFFKSYYDGYLSAVSKYPFIDNGASKILINHNGDERISLGEPLMLAQGYLLVINKVDKFYIELIKNGQVVDSKVLQPSSHYKPIADETYYYQTQIGDAKDIVQIAVHFKEINSNNAVLDWVWQISDTVER